MMLSSSFSEAQFSHATFIASGRRNRTGVRYLNIKQFVKFNYAIIEEAFELRKGDLDAQRAFFKQIVNALHEGFESNAEKALQELGFDSDEGQGDSEEEKTADELSTEAENHDTDEDLLSSHSEELGMCPKCNTYSMQKFKVADFPEDEIACDNQSCKRKKKVLNASEFFMGCTTASCELFDECLVCHELARR